MEFQVHSCDQIETSSSNRPDSTNHNTASAKTANSDKDMQVEPLLIQNADEELSDKLKEVQL